MLPVISGRGTIIAKDGLKTRFLKSGTTVLDLNLKFSKSKKNDDGSWDEVSSIWVKASAYGAFAEGLINGGGYQHLDQVDVQVEVSQGEYETSDGDVRHPVQGRLVSIGEAVRKKASSGGDDGESW